MSRTISFQRALQKAARLCGLDPNRLQPPELAEAFAEWIESRLNKVIKKFPWPELCPIEERPLRDAWSAGTSYTIGDQVAYQDTEGAWTYWEADGFPGAGLVPGSDDAEGIWVESSDYPRLISYEQADANRIYDVLNVWKEDPRKVTHARSIPYKLTVEGILLPRDVPATVFVQWREAGPRLTTQAYDAARTYTEDDVFYLPSDGHCYVPIETITGTSPATVPELFIQQVIPERIVNAANRGVKADWLADDGQDDKAFAQERRAEEWTEDDMADLTVHQHQTATYGPVN